jgi:hypothetical protein
VQRSLMVGSLSNSSLLLIPNHIPISLRLMEGERPTKHRNDGGRPNKRGKVVSGRSMRVPLLHLLLWKIHPQYPSTCIHLLSTPE